MESQQQWPHLNKEHVGNVNYSCPLEAARKLRGLKQVDLARLAGVDQRQISILENMRIQLKIADALEIDAGELFLEAS